MTADTIDINAVRGRCSGAVVSGLWSGTSRRRRQALGIRRRDETPAGRRRMPYTRIGNCTAFSEDVNAGPKKTGR